MNAEPGTRSGQTGPSDTGLTMGLAEWVAATRIEDIPAAVRHQVRRCLVDYLAATLAGAATEPARIVADYLTECDSNQSSALIGRPIRLSPPNAALANGTAAHALDLDDGYTPGGLHPGGPVISAALATAEALGSGADDIARAIALGYEVSCRLGGATHPHQRNRGFHNTAIAGVFGAATAVAVLHGLQPGQLANAYGLAGSHAGGLNAYLDEGSDVKRYHAGKAARDGMVSAELAARGLTAPTTVLEAARGYFHAFAGDQIDEQHLIADLGDEWRMTKTYFKPYPCCRHLHGAIDAALNLRSREQLSADVIESVRVDTFAIAAEHDRKEVGHMLDAQMSLPYAIGATLAFGTVGMEQFGSEAMNDPRLRRIVEATEVFADAELTAAYPVKRAARVTIRANGREHVDLVEHPYGEPENPISDQDLHAKFRRLVNPITGPERGDQVLDAAWRLSDPAELFRLIAEPGGSFGSMGSHP